MRTRRLAAGGRGGLAVLLATALATAAAGRRPPAMSQGIVAISGPAGDTLRDITPTFRVRTAGFGPGARPLQVGVQISTRSDFTGGLLADTIVLGDSAEIALRRPLPERTRIYWRGRARTAAGQDVFSEMTGPREVPPWVTLVSPNAPNGATLATRRPEFVWRVPAVSMPPGPWSFDLTITRANGSETRRYGALTDTVFTVPADLEGNTPYRWSVLARLENGTTADTARARSVATFIVTDASAPLVTLLYQNFPNPFPSRSSATTCIWFNLRSSGQVRLEIFDVRGNLARRLVPGPDIPSFLTPGQYGRASTGSNAGCDPRLAWDGTDDGGRSVPAGVYLVRLGAQGSEAQYRKILFRGR